VDLQRDERFADERVAVLSIATDPPASWAREAKNRNLRLPLLSDPNAVVSKSYGVMRWAVGAEPGHTFVLIDESGRIRWLRDYGAPENGGVMYVEPEDIYHAVAPFVAGSKSQE
jgi:peroxiredoxin